MKNNLSLILLAMMIVIIVVDNHLLRKSMNETERLLVLVEQWKQIALEKQ